MGSSPHPLTTASCYYRQRRFRSHCHIYLVPSRRRVRMPPFSLLFPRPGRQYTKTSGWKSGVVCLSRVRGMQAEIFRRGESTLKKCTSSQDAPSRASLIGGGAQRGWLSSAILLMPTGISSSHSQLNTVKLWRSTRRTIYRSTWTCHGLSMVTYYFGRGTVLGKLFRSNCVQGAC